MKESIVQHNDDNRELLSQQITFSSGPLPPPAILEKYNQVVPNAAERILVMAEEQSKHRRELEARVTKADTRDGILGIICGLTIGLAGMAVTVITSLYGQPVIGGIVGIGTLASLVKVFVYGSQQKRQERQEVRKLYR